MDLKRIPPFYNLPTEIIDRIVYFIVNRPEYWYYKGIKRDLLSISRVGRVGDRWMRPAEKELWKEMEIKDFETLKLLVEIESEDHRFHYIKEVEFYVYSSPEENTLAAGLKDFDLFYPRLKALRNLKLSVHYNIWLHLKPILHHIHNLSSLSLDINYNMNDFEEGEFVPISIANIPSLLSLEELDYSPGEDLKIFLGEEIRPKLQNLSISSIDSNLSHLYHHLPCLQVLYLGESNDGDNIFRVIPPSLRKLRSTAFILEDIRDLDIKDVIYLTSITMDDCDDLDYSILPFVPASIEVLELRCNDMEILVEALQSVQAGELKFGGLRVSEYLPGNLSEQDKNNQWDRVLKECNRLGIGLEKVVS